MGRVCASATHSTKNQRGDKHHQEDEEEDLRDPGRGAGDAAKAKDGRDQRDH